MMTVLIFFTAIMLILLSVAKPLVYKPVAQKYDFGFSAAFNCGIVVCFADYFRMM